MGAAIDTTGVQLMSENRARECVDGIRRHVDGVRELVFELYEGEGWHVLGYKSWRACVTAEFPRHERTLYKYLEAAKVERNICPIGQTPEPLPESQARELAKLKEPEDQREAWAEAVETAPEGKVTAKHVALVVAKYAPPTEPKAPKATKEQPEAAEPEDDGFESCPSIEVDEPVSWECPECSTSFDGHQADSDGWVAQGLCGHCEGLPEDEAVDDEPEPFNAALEATEVHDFVVEILARWPKGESFQPLIDSVAFVLQKLERLEKKLEQSK